MIINKIDKLSVRNNGAKKLHFIIPKVSFSDTIQYRIVYFHGIYIVAVQGYFYSQLPVFPAYQGLCPAYFEIFSGLLWIETMDSNRPVLKPEYLWWLLL